MKKILIVFGTRPEAIKMAPVVKQLQSNEHFNVAVCITAQHREMLDQVLQVFDIVPNYDLNIMQAGQDLFDITSKILPKLRDVILDFSPELIMVHGDTTTSFVAALSAYYLRIPVAHVEAGLRTGNIYSPFPEEMNRKLTGCITKYHFAPTLLAKENLLKENVSETDIFITGNTVIDALHLALKQIDGSIQIQKNIEELLSKYISLDILEKQFILITGHRRENFGEGFINICNALNELALAYPQTHFIYPVHLNPNVQKPVYEILGQKPNIHLIPPLDYLPFLVLMKKSYLLLTDSGGIQEEAPSLGKPVLVMRDTTERPEAVDAGTVKLTGANKENIVNGVKMLIDNKIEYNKMAEAHNPYGDGNAAKRIEKTLLSN